MPACAPVIQAGDNPVDGDRNARRRTPLAAHLGRFPHGRGGCLPRRQGACWHCPFCAKSLSLSLFQAGLVVSMFSLVAAFTGCFFGALSDRFGQLRLAIIGLVAASAAGAWGAQVHSGEWLIVTRVAEGIGFFMMSVSLARSHHPAG
jgi:MFS family permease